MITLDDLFVDIDPDEQHAKWCCGIPFSVNGPDTDRVGDKLCINGCCAEEFCIGCGVYTGGWGRAGCRCRAGGPGCSCRSCRRFHHSPPPRAEVQPMQGPVTLDEAYGLAGVWHLDDGCETCDERAAAARRGEW